MHTNGINTDYSDSDMGSFISLKRFEIINLVTGERQDQIGYF
jgi:hypothetical protein